MHVIPARHLQPTGTTSGFGLIPSTCKSTVYGRQDACRVQIGCSTHDKHQKHQKQPQVCNMETHPAPISSRSALLKSQDPDWRCFAQQASLGDEVSAHAALAKYRPDCKALTRRCGEWWGGNRMMPVRMVFKLWFALVSHLRCDPRTGHVQAA